MILHLTPTTAALVGEISAEWQFMEEQVGAGRWTTGAGSDEVPRALGLRAAPSTQSGGVPDGIRRLVAAKLLVTVSEHAVRRFAVRLVQAGG